MMIDFISVTIGLGAGLVGAVGGMLGVFLVLRRKALTGDVVSHAALPGIVLAFLLFGKNPGILMLGALLAGWLGMLLADWILKKSVIHEDSVLGLVLSVFFGLGLMLLTWLQRMPDASQAGLDRYLFGSAATLLRSDLYWMAAVALVLLLLLSLFWKEWKLLAFDPDYASLAGFPARNLDRALLLMCVTAIVLGLQTVGVVLMSSLVIAPAVAARQWVRRLASMVILAGFFGFLSGLVGTFFSLRFEGIPAGPAIVLVATCFAILSLLIAPEQGLLPAWWRSRMRHEVRE
jgi:manganese/zinc/iron transport system permease protein